MFRHTGFEFFGVSLFEANYDLPDDDEPDQASARDFEKVLLSDSLQCIYGATIYGDSLYALPRSNAV